MSTDLYNNFLDQWSEEWLSQLIAVFKLNFTDEDCLFMKGDASNYWHNGNINGLWISLNPNVTWKTIQDNPHIPWDYAGISMNENVTWEIVQSNPDKPWNYDHLSRNPNINWEIVYANPDNDWDYEYLKINPMIPHKNNYIRKCFQKHFMSCGLAEELISVVWHPRNFKKFKYLDPETFGEDEDDGKDDEEETKEYF